MSGGGSLWSSGEPMLTNLKLKDKEKGGVNGTAKSKKKELPNA